MNCQNYRELMIDYFEADLSSFTRDDIEQHLQQCECCRRQYDLTRMENQILQDTSDIPAIDPNFNSNVMNLIAAEASSIKIQRRFKWLPVYSKAAVAVALLLVCFYIPGIIPERQEDNTLLRAGSQAKTNSSSSSVIPRNISKTKIADDEVVTKSTYNDKNEPKGVSQKNPEIMTTSLPPSEQKKISRANPTTTVRSFKAESVAPGQGPTETLSLSNVPADFRLIKTDQMSENQIEYSYETQDGTQSILVKVMLAEAAGQSAAVNDSLTQEAQPMSSVAMDNAGASENESVRDIKYDGKIYQITVSGNLSQEEIDHITNDISLSTNP